MLIRQTWPMDPKIIKRSNPVLLQIWIRPSRNTSQVGCLNCILPLFCLCFLPLFQKAPILDNYRVPWRDKHLLNCHFPSACSVKEWGWAWAWAWSAGRWLSDKIARKVIEIFSINKFWEYRSFASPCGNLKVCSFISELISVEGFFSRIYPITIGTW